MRALKLACSTTRRNLEAYGGIARFVWLNPSGNKIT